MKKPNIGGQAVLEGVMMRSPVTEKLAICVRRTDGTMALSEKPAPVAKSGPASWPFLRGVVNFVRMLVLGMGTLTDSAQMLGEEYEEEPSAFEKWLAKTLRIDTDQVVLGAAVVLALVLAIGLFFVLPNLAASLISRWVKVPILVNLIEGAVRIGIFLLYLTLVTRMEDIRRTFGYHGAEHKVVNCFEADLPLTVENARKMTTRNPRCGTSFILFVMLISILVFSLTGWNGGWLGRLLIRLALLPVVASLSYELLMLLARYDNACIRVLRAPGLALQGLTTREPDDSMLECALAAFVAVLTPEQRAAQVPEDYRLPTEMEAEPENENPEGIVTEKPKANEPGEEPEETEAVEAVEAPLLPDDNDDSFPDKR